MDLNGSWWLVKLVYYSVGLFGYLFFFSDCALVSVHPFFTGKSRHDSR